MTTGRDRREPNDGRRRPYRKPTLERVRIAADDAVLGACKNPGHQVCIVPPFGKRPGS